MYAVGFINPLKRGGALRLGCENLVEKPFSLEVVAIFTTL